MRRWATVLLACSVICRPLVLMAQEPHSHPVPEKLGTVNFPISCSPGVGAAFARGVALLHSFAYTASEQAFLAVADADPACAMAHWGIAMSYFHQLWEPPNTADDKGLVEVDKARRLGAESARERQYIKAVAAYYGGAQRASPTSRAKDYAQAMAAVARANPADPEAQVFYALALLATADAMDRSHANQKHAAAILEPIFREQPQHPGVAHYLIHAYDNAELAPRGLAVAHVYSRIAPAAPHALHMPSHIFTRLGYWDDSIASNQAARGAAHDQGDVGEELHAMDYLTYAYLQRGREAEAQHIVEDLRLMGNLPVAEFRVGYAATAMPVRLAIERHDWASAASLRPFSQAAPQVTAITYWARALAQVRAGHPREADSDLRRLEACHQELQAAGNFYWAAQLEVQDKEVLAWRSLAQGRASEATQLLRQAADQEDALEKLPVTPGPIVPAREQLGELFLDLKQPQDALREFQINLANAPGRRSALSGAAQAADLVGNVQAATRLRAKLSEQSDAARVSP